MDLESGPLEEVGAASMAEAYRSGWGASEGLPCSASGEGSCEVLRDRRACCGSSCSRRGWNSSKGAGYAAHNKMHSDSGQHDLAVREKKVTISAG